MLFRIEFTIRIPMQGAHPDGAHPAHQRAVRTLQTKYQGRYLLPAGRLPRHKTTLTLMASYCYICLHKATKVKEKVKMTIVIALLIVGWVAASVIGTQAYFLGEQSKPIHERNWNDESFEQLAKSVTGTEVDYLVRVPAYSMDAYASRTISNR